jgi:hypothetical protein
MDTNTEDALDELNRLRNRHVRKFIEHLGDHTPPYLQIHIKKTLTNFADDVADYVLPRQRGEAVADWRDGK